MFLQFNSEVHVMHLEVTWIGNTIVGSSSLILTQNAEIWKSARGAASAHQVVLTDTLEVNLFAVNCLVMWISRHDAHVDP